MENQKLKSIKIYGKDRNGKIISAEVQSSTLGDEKTGFLNLLGLMMLSEANHAAASCSEVIFRYEET